MEELVQQPEFQQQPPKLQKVYNFLKKRNKTSAATYEEFESKMQDDNKLSRVYEYLKSENKVKSENIDDFKESVGLKKKDLVAANGPLPQPTVPPQALPGSVNSGTPSAPSSPPVTDQDRSDVRDYLKDLDARNSGSNPDRERNPLVNAGKIIWNLATRDIPSALASAGAVIAPGLYQQATMEQGGGAVKHDEINSSPVIKDIKKELTTWAVGKKGESAEYSKNLINSLDKIEDPIDAANWFLGAVSQAGVQIPAALATGGASSFGQEIGGIYLSSVERIAKEKGLTPEQVIEQGLDAPATALAYGSLAGAFDYLGAGKVAGAFTKDALKKGLRQRAMAALQSGAVVEPVTEYFQTWLEQVGEEQSAGKGFGQSVEDVLVSPEKKKERLEALAQGAAAGGAAHAVGSATQAKKGETVQTTDGKQDVTTTVSGSDGAVEQPGIPGAGATEAGGILPESVQQPNSEESIGGLDQPAPEGGQTEGLIPPGTTMDLEVPQSTPIPEPQSLEAAQAEATPQNETPIEETPAEQPVVDQQATEPVEEASSVVASSSTETGSPSVYEKGQQVNFDWHGAQRTGRIQGVTEDGRVKIQDRNKINYTVQPDRIGFVDKAEIAAQPKQEDAPTAYNSKRKKPIGIVSNGMSGPNSFMIQTDLGKKMKEFFTKYFTTRGYVPQDVFNRWIQASGQIGKYESQVKFTLGDMKSAIKSEYNGKPTDDQITDINLALSGKKPNNPIPPKVQAQVDEMRAQIDNLSRQFIQDGIVTGDLAAKFQKNLGTYLTRSYRKHDDPFWAEFVDPRVKNKAEAFLRGKFPQYNDEEIEGLINSIMYDPQSPGALLKGARLGSKDLSILKKREDIAPELRALMGEYGDPLLNYARTITKMSNLVAKHHFLQDVKKMGMGAFLFDRPTGKYSVPIAAEGSKTMAPLNGLYTTQEIAEAFQEFNSQEPMGEVLKAYMKLNGAIKLGKTVFSVMTHARNLLGNIGFATMNGHWRADKIGKAAQIAWANLYSNDQKVRDKFKEYVELGVVQDSGAAGELRQYINDIKNGQDFFERISDSKLKKVYTGTIDAVKNLYQFEDDLYKIYAFENELARYRKAFPNLTEQEVKEKAARIVRDTYPTYSMVPKIVKMNRANPLVGSFVSFPAEVLRTTYNTLGLIKEELANPSTRSIGVQRLAGTLLATLGPTAASYASMALIGLDGQDDDDLRRFVAPWQRNSEFFYLSNKGDKYSLVDMGYSDPHSYLKRPVYDLLKGDDLAKSAIKAAGALAEPFLSEELLAERLIDISRNQKENGDHVYNPDGSAANIAADVYSHFKPIAEPGTVLSLRRILAGAQGKTDKYGNKYDLEQELVGTITGQKAETKDVTQALLFKAFELKDRVDGTQKEYMRVSRSKATTDEEKAKAKEKRDAAMNSITNEAREIYLAAIRLGVDPKEARRDMFRTRSPEIVRAIR